jgi:hypothetical protein
MSSTGAGDALQVLDVHGRDHVNTGFEQFQHVLPALAVAAGPWHVGVGQFVHQHDARPPS